MSMLGVGALWRKNKSSYGLPNAVPLPWRWLRCVLSNAAHPEYGQVTIPFPIPGMEYERTAYRAYTEGNNVGE